MASEAASATSMLRGVVRGVATGAVRDVVRVVARDALRLCRESKVASLVRGLMEPAVLLIPLRSVGESRSRFSTGADCLLPMLRRVHGFVACECVVGE